MGKKKVPLEERFWSYVDKRGEDECWNWTGSCFKDGYGQIADTDTKRNLRTHRYSYELHKGPIPKEKCVCHRCDNPSCVNPKHLFLGTHWDNKQDSLSKGRAHIPKHPDNNGENNGRAKLTANQVREIKRMLANGIEQAIVAEKFSVCTKRISSINTGTSWKSVTLDG